MIRDLFRSTKALTTVIILLLTLSCGYHYIDFAFQIKSNEAERVALKEQFAEMKWEMVKNIISSLNHEQEFYTKVVSYSFKKNLEDEYRGDLTRLKYDLDIKNYVNSGFGKVVTDTTLEGHSFDKYKSNRSGVLISCNDQLFYNLIKPANTFNISWTDFIANNYNEKLAIYTYDLIRKQSPELKVIEPNQPANYESHTKINKSSLEDLKSIYYKEGLEGFYSYLLVYSCYITPSGDIFGTFDYGADGTRRENHKLTVMSYVSIYDTISKYHMSRISNLENIESAALKSNKNKLISIYKSSINTAIVHIIMIVLCFIAYKIYLSKYDD